MTELETMQRAKGYLDKLALGIDPLTGREVPEDSVLNNVRLARCFFYVSDVLERLIANGGQTERKPKLQPFAINAAQLARVQVSREPVRITQMVERISTAADNPQMRKLSTTVITNWLLEKGFLQKQTGMDGKSRRVPTQEGFGSVCPSRPGSDNMENTRLYTIMKRRSSLCWITWKQCLNGNKLLEKWQSRRSTWARVLLRDLFCLERGEGSGVFFINVPKRICAFMQNTRF